ALEQFYDRRAAQLRERLQAGEGRVQSLNAEREVVVRVPLRAAARAVAEALGRESLLVEPAEDDERCVTLPVRIAPMELVLLLDEAPRLLHRPPSLKVFGPAEGMVVYLKVALLCGVLLGSPWVFGQLWAFVAAGLYPSEKRLVHVYLPVSVGLFFA